MCEAFYESFNDPSGKPELDAVQHESFNDPSGKPEFDAVQRPSHYADKSIEVIDYIRDTLTHAGFIDFCLGNVIKYVSRWRKKGGVEDLKKASVYLNWAIEAEKETKGNESR